MMASRQDGTVQDGTVPDGTVQDGTVQDAAQGKRSDRTKAVIVRAARERFAAHGYERTTIRAIAADAEIDPSMVMRYFGSKEQLFDAALSIDLRLPDLTAVPPERLSEVIVRHFLDRWEGDPADDALLVLLRSAVTNERAAQRIHQIFGTQVAPALAAALGPEAAGRAALVCTQLLGLAVTRYLLRLPAVAALDPDAVTAALAPAVEAILHPRPRPRPQP
ncbi:TetR family transcriptional regulator [Streptacidiphilus sp. EB129]|uniref:TetR/AcrR family transcriptional regulator n=1 Tax=Streptacidiphilus sp. EB129 TaxID=3156262 RepID=UPI0035132A96